MRKTITFNCENCRKEKTTPEAQFVKSKRHFCSRSCFNKFSKNNSTQLQTACCRNCKNTFSKRSAYKIVFCCKTCLKEYPRRHIEIPKIIEMYEMQMMTIAEIARKTHSTDCIIRAMLCENNVKMRDPKWFAINKPPAKGTKRTEEHKRERSRISKNAYIKYPELREQMRKKMLKQISDGKMPQVNTGIEKIMASTLVELEIPFIFQKVFGYWCYDFYLPDYDLFLECDGDYWHAHPQQYHNDSLNETQRKNKKRDERKERYVLVRGHNIIRFWEREINNSLEEVKIRLLNKMEEIKNQQPN